MLEIFVYLTCMNQNEVPILEIYVNLTCMNQAPVHSKHNRWSQGGSV